MSGDKTGCNVLPEHFRAINISTFDMWAYFRLIEKDKNIMGILTKSSFYTQLTFRFKLDYEFVFHADKGRTNSEGNFGINTFKIIFK